MIRGFTHSWYLYDNTVWCACTDVFSRDAFYSALQEWELHHNMPDWNFQSVLRDRIRCSSTISCLWSISCSYHTCYVVNLPYRLLMNQPPELCSLHHLAILFQKQLLEVLTHTVQCMQGRLLVWCGHVELWLCCTYVSWSWWTGRTTEEPQPRQTNEVSEYLVINVPNYVCMTFVSPFY